MDHGRQRAGGGGGGGGGGGERGSLPHGGLGARASKCQCTVVV